MKLIFFVTVIDAQRTRYLNAVNTFKELLSMGVVPIVNENDTISVSVRPVFLFFIAVPTLRVLRESDRTPNIQEIKFGDNDTLSAITSSMVHADYLFLLTDVDGLYSANPRKDPNAKFLEVVSSVAEARLEGGSHPSLHFATPSPSSISILFSPGRFPLYTIMFSVLCFFLSFHRLRRKS